MKFSIVTACFQSGRFLREAAESVISQEGDFDVEYVVVDGESTDDSISFLRDLETRLKNGSYPIRCRSVHFRWSSERDAGMYDALAKGFANVSGDVQAWINADDLYLPGCFEAVKRAFEAEPRVRWLKGITNYMNEASAIVERGECYLYSQEWIQKGVYGRAAFFIQQDSVFWRADLWTASGGIDPSYRYAGDYSLWCRMAEHSPLTSLPVALSCFRRVHGQLSENTGAYSEECERARPTDPVFESRVRFYFRVERRLPKCLRPTAYRIFFGKQRLRVISGNPASLRVKSYYTGTQR